MKWPMPILLLLIFSMNGILTGCSASPTIPPPTIKKIDAVATDPEPGCDYPEFNTEKIGDATIFILDETSFSVLLVCQRIARTNYVIAFENAAALREAKQQINAMVDSINDRHNLANYAIEDADQRRRESVIEAWAAKGLLVIVLIASL